MTGCYRGGGACHGVRFEGGGGEGNWGCRDIREDMIELVTMYFPEFGGLGGEEVTRSELQPLKKVMGKVSRVL